MTLINYRHTKEGSKNKVEHGIRFVGESKSILPIQLGLGWMKYDSKKQLNLDAQSVLALISTFIIM